MTPEEYCRERAARSGSSFYYSFLFLPKRERRAVTALYAFCREVDDVVDECREPALAHIKLAWWREELVKARTGQAHHPVTRALAPFLPEIDSDLELLPLIIDGMEMDLTQNRYRSFAELESYCYRAASVVGLLVAKILGYSDPATLDYARDLGIALQLTNILRDLREDYGRGRIYIPLDELEQFGVPPRVFAQSAIDEPLRALLRYQAERAEGYYQRAFAALPEVDRYQQRGGLVMGAIYHALLNEIVADGYRVLEYRVALTPLRKLWIAWRTLRQEKRYRPALKREAE